MRYEGFSPNKVAVIVEALTDNKNRTASNVRSIFGKRGGAMGETGSVSVSYTHLSEAFAVTLPSATVPLITFKTAVPFLT